MSHVESELLAYLDGELSPADVRSVEAHLASCSTCRATLDELRALSAGMAETVPAIYESVHLSAEADTRIRSALAAERARLERRGSLQQGLAGMWSGLLGVGRPLSKAAIPLMAVFLTVLSLNSVRLPVQAGAQQTVVLGQDTLAPGSQAALRVVVRDTANDQPVANANVAIQLRQAGLAKTVYSGSTDATGSAPVQFAVPADWQGSAELVVNTESELGDDQVVAPILLERSYRLLLSSDKPVYQPGEILHLRTLALGQVDGKPAAGTTIRFEVVDPTGREVAAQDRVASEYGIASMDFPLPADAAFGQHQIRAILGDTISELSVTLGQAPLPKFRVDVLPDAPYYQPGDQLTGGVRASYFYGKPVAGAPVSLKLVGTRPGADPLAGDQVVFSAEQAGTTDDTGTFIFQFDLPVLPVDAFAEDDTLMLALETTVTDPAGDSEFGWQKTTLARQPILIDVVPEDGVLHTGVENILYVLTSYPDGQPAPTSLQVQIGAAASFDQVTNDYGLAEVRYTPRSGAEGDRQVSVTATDAAGHVARTIVALPLDEAAETLLLRTDRALYEVGETMAVETIATGAGNAVYLDVIKGGQTLLTTSGLIEDGKATLAVDLTPELAGTLELNAYQVGNDDALLRDSRAIVVDAPEDLQVDISTDKAEYRPGEEAQVTIQTSRAGEGAESAVGLSVVNEAVYAQREYQPGFARAYFLLDQELQSTGLSLPSGSAAAGDAQNRAAVRDAQQLAAKASWAAYGGQDYSLATRSVDDDSRSQVNAQRQRTFSRLSLVIGLALILASIAVAIVVINGLRRSGVLGQAAGRLLLTVIILLVAGAALLFLTQSLLATLPSTLAAVVLAATGLVWFVLLLALFVYGVRRRDHRAQYVALWLFTYAVLLALLAFAASQGATLASIWLILLAGSFGLLLAALLLFGWGLRAEGAKAAGAVTLMLALLVMPLVVALNAVDLSGSDVIKSIAGPSVYGLNGGLLTGCAAPAAAPRAGDQSPDRNLQDRAAPAAPQVESASGEAIATPAGEVEQSAAVAEPQPETAELAPAEAPAEAAVEAPLAAKQTAPQPTATAQPEVAGAALTLSEPISTPVAPLFSLVTPTATVEISTFLPLPAAQAITETAEASALAAGFPVTASEVLTSSIAELRIPITATLTPTATVTVTPTLLGGLEPRRAAAESLTPTATTQSEDVAAAALVASPTPTIAPPTPTATPEPIAPSPAPLPTPEAIATLAPELSSAPAVETSVPTPEPTPTPAIGLTDTAVAAEEVRVKEIPAPTSVPLEALPIIRERFPQTLYWNPEVITDANGRVQVAIPTGGAITSWRIMAQAVDRNGKLGSSTALLTVFQPLFLVPNVPTSMLLGEEAAGQVQIYNYGSEPQTVTLTSHATPGLQLSQSEFRVTVGPNDVVSVPVLLRATQVGAQTATWVAIGDSAQDARQITMTVK